MQPASNQPIGFWAARVGDAVRHRTRSRLAEIGVSQPEWWLLHQLSLHPAGLDTAAIIDTIGPNDTDQAVIDAIASASDKGWVAANADHLVATDAGTAVFERAAQVQRELEAERRQGIVDDDYATAIRVLQRTARNVGSDAWHW